MKKLTLFFLLILVAFLGYPQNCGSYVDLIGTGMVGKTEATLTINDHENVEKIIVEAIHKSETDPIPVTFSSSEGEVVENVAATEVNYSGVTDISPLSANIYRAELAPAEMVSIQAGTNEIFSFCAYVFRKPAGISSTIHGELYHVFQNGDDPLVIDIPLPVTDHPRDLRVKFGITELDEDERYAIFRLKAGENTEEITLFEWDELAGEEESFTIQEIFFEDVPGIVDQIEMVLISPVYTDIRTGDSFVSGVAVVDFPCDREPEIFCIYTQGFYGNEGGKTCAGETTRELLARLLADDLIMGDGENTFTIPAGAVDCVLEILPGGGPSAALSGALDCNDRGSVAGKQGRLNNTLLAQGITLALNLRNSPELIEFPVDGEPFLTHKVEDCLHPDLSEIPGSGVTQYFKPELVDFLGEGATIGDLIDLVNYALGGGDISPLSLSNVSDAATLVNEAFDECVVVASAPVDKEAVEEPGDDQNRSGGNDEGGDEGGDEGNQDGNKEEGPDVKGVTGLTEEQQALDPVIYPNPASDRFFLILPGNKNSMCLVQLYNSTGRMVKSYELPAGTGNERGMELNINDLLPGIYILKIETGTTTLNSRLSIN